MVYSPVVFLTPALAHVMTRYIVNREAGEEAEKILDRLALSVFPKGIVHQQF